MLIKTLILFTNISTGDTYVTMTCCLTVCTAHFANSSEHCVELHIHRYQVAQ